MPLSNPKELKVTGDLPQKVHRNKENFSYLNSASDVMKLPHTPIVGKSVVVLPCLIKKVT